MKQYGARPLKLGPPEALYENLLMRLHQQEGFFERLWQEYFLSPVLVFRVQCADDVALPANPFLAVFQPALPVLDMLATAPHTAFGEKAEQ